MASEAWKKLGPAHWESADGRFGIYQRELGVWRLTELVCVGRRSCGRCFAVMEYDRTFLRPNLAQSYAMRLARQLAATSEGTP